MHHPFKELLLKGLVATILLLSLSACGGGARPFVPIEKGIAFKPARLAVISCETDDLGTHFVEAVTKEMQERTTFQVLSQKEIAKKVGKYPFDIKIVEKAADPEKPNWLDPSEAKTLRTLQSKLKADYIFVVWGRNLQHQVITSQYGSTEYYYMSVFGNMFAYPEGNLVTFTDYSYNRKAGLLEVLSFKKPSFYVESLINNSAKYLVSEIIKTTAAGKKL